MIEDNLGRKSFVDRSAFSDITRKLNAVLAGELVPFSEEMVLTSEDVLEGQVTTREIELGEERVIVDVLTRIGGPGKKVNEDGFVVMWKGSVLQVIVVDGGTQSVPVRSLEAIGTTGGKFIATQVEKHATDLDPTVSVERNLGRLNQRIGEEVRVNHPDILYRENSANVPYGSIAGIRLDIEQETLEVANAGDITVVGIDREENPSLLTVDDVRKHDALSFEIARHAARAEGKTVRQILEERHPQVLLQMQETMKKGNRGEIRRITGAPNFEITASKTVGLSDIVELLLFSDGGIPIPFDLHTQNGLEAFVELVKEEGIRGVEEKVRENALSDPDFENTPRFRDVDDFTMVRITLRRQTT